MRKEWFDHVRKTREKETRRLKRLKGKKSVPCTHRRAMQIASSTWGKEKAKLLKKRKNKPVVKKSKPAEIVDENVDKSEDLTVEEI